MGLLVYIIKIIVSKMGVTNNPPFTKKTAGPDRAFWLLLSTTVKMR